LAHARPAEAGTGIATAHAVLERGVAVLVVHAALAAVREDLVGLLALLERSLGLGVAGVAVRVVLHRAAAIGLLEFILGGAACNAEDFVIVALAHRSGPCCLVDPPVRGPDTRREPGFMPVPANGRGHRGQGPLPRLRAVRPCDRRP